MYFCCITEYELLKRLRSDNCQKYRYGSVFYHIFQLQANKHFKPEKVTHPRQHGDRVYIIHLD